MIQTLMVTCVVLVALCRFQWRALRDIKQDLAGANIHTSLVELEGRGEETVRAVAWLDALLREARPDRVGGLCTAGTLDVATMQRLIFDTYLRRRAGGASELEARAEVLKALRGTSL